MTEGFSNVKALPKENIISKFNKKSFEVQILNLDKKNFKFASINLNKEIDPEASYVKQTNSGLTIFLKKIINSDHWDCLEYKKPIVSDPSERKAPSNEKDPNAGLMEMMKEMYQNGDPEMKKIIAESFTKSQSGEQLDNKKSKMPGMGGMGGMPGMGGMGGMPGMGGMGGMPGMDDEAMGGMDMAAMAKMFGGMPGMEGGMPGMEGGMDMANMAKMFGNMGKK